MIDRQNHAECIEAGVRPVPWSPVDMNALQQGATRMNRPIDHRCGSSQSGEGVTFDEMIKLLDERLDTICHLHRKIDTGVADIDGSSAECDHRWPCPSYHVAAGFGLAAFYECENTVVLAPRSPTRISRPHQPLVRVTPAFFNTTVAPPASRQAPYRMPRFSPNCLAILMKPAS